MQKRQFINELKAGDSVKDLFMVRSMSLNSGKNGSYLALVLTDKTGDIESRLWDINKDYSAPFEVGDIVAVDATVTEYQGRLQLRIYNIEKTTDQADRSHFLPSSSHDKEDQLNIIKRSIAKIKNRYLRRLARAFMGDPELLKKFSEAPAAKKLHHNYIGGLLDHTVSILKLVDTITRLYPFLNRDLLIIGALFHDIGKIEMIDYKKPFEYTESGKLIGHLVSSAIITDRLIQRIQDFPQDLRTLVLHLILSHHGSYDAGSPVLPQLLEAFVLHRLDELDARIVHVNLLTNEGDKSFTSYQKMYDRALVTRRWIDDVLNDKDSKEDFTLKNPSIDLE